jgi:hypothetical protein
MKICVLSRTDHPGQCDPRVFHLGGCRLSVVTILGQWGAPPRLYFKVRVEDGRRFVLSHDPATGCWELAAALPRT